MKTQMNLNGIWKLACSACEGVRPDEKWIDVQVPGDVTVSLSQAGQLPEDLFYRENLKEAKWVESKYWWYTTSFELECLPKNRLELIFKGLDLFATVYVNGEKAGASDNAFKPFRFDVSRLVKQGENRVDVEFAPTREMVEKLHEKYPEYWSLFTPGRSLVRHAQCQFGWDWAPEALALGIWQDVFLEECDGAKIENLFVEAQLDGDCCVRIELPLLEQEELPKGVPLANIPPYYAVGTLHAGIYYNGELLAEGKVETGGVHNFICLQVDNPRWWWPNGMGEQELYECRVTLTDEAGVEQDSMTKIFGFRAVVIEEKKLETDRISFTFLVNGERCFIKGANWVPAHCFPGAVEEDTYAYLVSRAQQANYNMLRIWGGGIYENDRFYEECDRRGIMVWQDFMNACAEPPDDDDFFLRNIIEEAEFQVKRLRNHPSVACWCGGNESSSSHRYEPDRPGRRLCRYYYRGVVGDLSPSTPYIPGSSHGKSDFGQIQTSGETHWSMWPRTVDDGYGTYRDRLKDVRTVFNGEICLQGPSPLASQLQFLEKSDIWPPNDVVDFHVMRHPALPEVHPRFVTSQIAAAEEIIGPCDSAESFINNAMMAHAEMVRNELGFYRSTKWSNSGAMLWMFNECWPCSNWANVDFFGALKPAYWVEKRLFAPLAVAMTALDDQVLLYLLNDTLQEACGDLYVYCMDITSEIFWEEKVEGLCPANRAVVAASYAKSALDGDGVFLRMEWRVNEQTFAEHWFPALFKDIAFESPRLQWELKGNELTITSENYARFVYIDIPLEQVRKVTLGDNYFDMIPGETRTIQVCGVGPVGSVNVTSLLSLKPEQSLVPSEK